MSGRRGFTRPALLMALDAAEQRADAAEARLGGLRMGPTCGPGTIDAALAVERGDPTPADQPAEAPVCATCEGQSVVHREQCGCGECQGAGTSIADGDTDCSECGGSGDGLVLVTMLDVPHKARAGGGCEPCDDPACEPCPDCATSAKAPVCATTMVISTGGRVPSAETAAALRDLHATVDRMTAEQFAEPHCPAHGRAPVDELGRCVPSWDGRGEQPVCWYQVTPASVCETCGGTWTLPGRPGEHLPCPACVPWLREPDCAMPAPKPATWCPVHGAGVRVWDDDGSGDGAEGDCVELLPGGGRCGCHATGPGAETATKSLAERDAARADAARTRDAARVWDERMRGSVDAWRERAIVAEQQRDTAIAEAERLRSEWAEQVSALHEEAERLTGLLEEYLGLLKETSHD